MLLRHQLRQHVAGNISHRDARASASLAFSIVATAANQGAVNALFGVPAAPLIDLAGTEVKEDRAP